jgi:hypothetical protein
MKVVEAQEFDWALPAGCDVVRGAEPVQAVA